MKFAAVYLMTVASMWAQGSSPPDLGEQARAIINLALTAGWELPLFKLPAITKIEKTELRCGDYIIRNTKPIDDGVSKGPAIILHFEVPTDPKSPLQMMAVRSSRIVTEVVKGWAEGPRARPVWNSAKTLIEKMVIRLSEADYEDAKICLQ